VWREERFYAQNHTLTVYGALGNQSYILTPPFLLLYLPFLEPSHRLCVTEYLETSLGGATSCPDCSQPLTVDLSKKEGQQEEEDEAQGRSGRRTWQSNGNGGGSSSSSGANANAAGTVIVAGKLKVRSRCEQLWLGGCDGGCAWGVIYDERMCQMICGSFLTLSILPPSLPPFLPQLQGLDRKSILHRIQLENFQTSTKLEALLEELHLMRARDPSAKAIVFSQFVNMLDLIMWRLTAEGTKVGLGEEAKEGGKASSYFCESYDTIPFLPCF